MKVFFVFILVFGVLVGTLSSCDSSSGLSDLVGLASEDDDEDDDRRRTRRGRSRGRSTNDCEDSERCQIICDQILEYTAEREACYYLSLSEIGRVEDVFDILKKPTSTTHLTRNINQKDFDLFVEIALDSWEKVINGQYRKRRREEEDYGTAGPYSARQAETVLNWIVGNAFVGNVLLDYDGVDILYNLFLNLGEDKNNLTKRTGHNDQLQMRPSQYIEFDSEEYVDVAKGLAYDSGNLSGDYSYLWNFALGDTDSGGAYDLVHQVVQKVCSDAEIEGSSVNLSSKEEYKICLSAFYVCENLRGVDLTGLLLFTLNRQSSVGKYLISSRYRTSTEDGAVTCDNLVAFDNWSDYWEGTHSP